MGMRNSMDGNTKEKESINTQEYQSLDGKQHKNTKKAQQIMIGVIVLIAVLIAGGIGTWLAGSRQAPEEKLAPAVLIENGADTATFKIGVLAADADEKIYKQAAFEPIAEYLTGKLDSYGITKAKVVTAKTSAEMAKLMRQGDVDMFVDSPFSPFIVAKLAEAEPFVNGWRKGNEKYSSIIFTRTESGINTLEDLKGRMICFEDSSSTSGYLLPKAELLNRGYTVTRKSEATDPVAPDEIGYYFTFTDVKVVEDAVKGIAAACSTKQADVDNYLETNRLPVESVRTILTSIDVFQRIAVIRKKIDPELKQALKQILLGMEQTVEGRAALDKAADAGEMNKFGEFLPSADVAFAEFEPLSNLVEEEIVRQ
jgi:phosphonate transport system substrate-binding protein